MNQKINSPWSSVTSGNDFVFCSVLYSLHLSFFYKVFMTHLCCWNIARLGRLSAIFSFKKKHCFEWSSIKRLIWPNKMEVHPQDLSCLNHKESPHWSTLRPFGFVVATTEFCLLHDMKTEWFTYLKAPIKYNIARSCNFIPQATLHQGSPCGISGTTRRGYQVNHWVAHSFTYTHVIELV